MKVPAFLKFLMPIFICIALIRSLNDAGGISLDQVLLQLQTFEFDFQEVADFASLFRDYSWVDTYLKWDYSLTGIEGFFTNVANTFIGFFNYIVFFISSLGKAIWNLFYETVFVIVRIFYIVADILGFGFEVTGGHRGGR